MATKTKPKNSQKSELKLVNVALVGARRRDSQLLKLLIKTPGIKLVRDFDLEKKQEDADFVKSLGISTSTDFSDLSKLNDLDLIIQFCENSGFSEKVIQHKPLQALVISGQGVTFLSNILEAKEKKQEQLSVALREAFKDIRSQEKDLDGGFKKVESIMAKAREKEAKQKKLYIGLRKVFKIIRSREKDLEASLKKAEEDKEKVEEKLAEIFFNHEFFKALTTHVDLDEVSDLVVDGTSGIMGAEFSCLYLLDQGKKCLELQAWRGLTMEHFRRKVKVGEDILGKAADQGKIIYVSSEDKKRLETFLTEPLKGKFFAAAPLIMKDKVLGVLGVVFSFTHALDDEGKERLVTISNIAALALQNAMFNDELKQLSITDRLTGLYNHGYFQQRMVEEYNRARRYNRKFSLIMLDIDHFKDFNDRFGHPKGDVVLRDISQLIRDNARRADVVARYGGEEFIIILPEIGKQAALMVAERLRKKVENCEFKGDKKQKVVHKTVSLGVATYPVDGNSAADLIGKVDDALYQAKESGRNHTVAAKKS